MSKTLQQKLNGLTAARRERIERRANALVAEEMTLQELRRAYKLTQAELARNLGMTQDQVSRLEQRTDILLSTLSKYVQGMGGNLSLVAEFPDRNPVKISGLSVVEPGRTRTRKTGRAA
jgi:DNA-binding transcriptional regulator YiaG